MLRAWGLHPYRDPWIMRLTRKKAWALTIFLAVGTPFIIIGGIAALAWLIGYALFEPGFWLLLAAIWVWLLITK